MAAATEHYEDLLADRYTWMLGGDIAAPAEEESALLRGLGVSPDKFDDAVAVDLGCGSGAQSLALAGLGFRSIAAVDTSRKLLDELARHAGERSPVRPVLGDIRTALPRVAAPGTAASSPWVTPSPISPPRQT